MPLLPSITLLIVRNAKCTKESMLHKLFWDLV